MRSIGVVRAKRQELRILDGCSGSLRPGRLTLLLGPPGSGKSTLLKALSDKLGNSGLEVRPNLTPTPTLTLPLTLKL